MPTRLATRAVEKSSFIVRASFTDAEGNPMVPATLSWTLTNAEGSVINGRHDVSVGSPACPQDIVLSGDDLALYGANDRGARVLTLKGTYYCSLAGESLPFTDSARFFIQDLSAVD
ncbi:MAG: hypothetical protein JRI97_06910 [Deltaproteobacteria bacterium]|nr:hypothetical protein [Deltaproteobacteria bacterium]